MGAIKEIEITLKERIIDLMSFDIGDFTVGLLDNKPAMEELKELLWNREDIVLWVIQQEYLSNEFGLESCYYELLGNRFMNGEIHLHDYDDVYDEETINRFKIPTSYAEATSYYYINRFSRRDDIETYGFCQHTLERR